MERTRPEARPAPASSAGPHLCAYLVLCGERPLLGGMAFDLTGVKEVVIGRGGPLGASARGPGSARIDVPDGTMSGEHEPSVRTEAGQAGSESFLAVGRGAHQRLDLL